MRRLRFGVVCAAAFAIHTAPSQASCVATLNWHGYTYIGLGSGSGLKAGAAISLPARQPSCNDTIGPEGPKPVTYTDQPVARVEGVEPSIALRTAYGVYVNRSTFPTLKSHPLYRWRDLVPTWLAGSGGEPCQVKGPAVINATGLFVNGARIVVEPDTNVELQRHGTAFIPPGTQIRVGGSACRRVHEQIVIVARRIARA